MSNARHRRPTSHSTTGSMAVVGSLALAATSGSVVLAPAAAASDTDWDAVARCESGGNWSINTGNGFSGGLQFTASTWRAYGGSGSPQNASRSAQIAVAERVLAGQGIGAWPVCGRRGLGGTTVHRADPPPRHRADPTPSAARRPRTVPTTPPVRPTTSPRTTQAPRTPRSPRVTEETPVPPPRHPDTGPTARYTIRPGDTLSGIAGEHRVPGGYRAIARANPAIADVDMIYAGEALTLPTTTRPLAVPQSRSAPPAPPRIQGPLETISPRSTTTHTTPPRTEGAAAVGPTSHAASASMSRIVATARTWIGVPYRWGGTTRAGVDCSGLVQQVFRANGTILPRTADAQMHATTRISRAEARPGDLAFGVTGGYAHHVGIVIGGGQMIDAPQSGSTVGVHRYYSDTTAFGRP